MNRERFQHSAVRRLGIGLAVLLLAVATVTACARPHDDASAFDPTRKQLSAEKRQQYELLFFNEFAMRNAGNEDIDADAKRRYELFQKMANDGYELAAIGLQLYDIRRHRLEGRYDEAAHKRLEELAEAGDGGAMCFTWYGLKTTTTPGPVKKYVRYVQKGADMGQPSCMYTLSFWYADGLHGLAKNPELAIELRTSAARSGLLSAQDYLHYQYHSGDGVPKNPAKALCWARAAAKSEVGSKYNRMKGNLMVIEEDLRRNDLDHIIEAQDKREHRTGKACDL